MRARLVIAAISGLSVATAVAAEPAKAPVRKADQAAEQPVEVVVAAADEIRTPTASADQATAAPAKRARKARVTTCRCGDQPPSN